MQVISLIIWGMRLTLQKNNHTMIKKISIILIAFIISSCTTIKVVNINEAEKYYENAIIYSLPETVLKVDIELKKTSYIKGPFSEYAEKYLNITNVITENSTSWNIVNIDINSYAEPDYNNYYALESNNKALMNGLSLNEKGVIASINKHNTKKRKLVQNDVVLNLDAQNEDIIFTDLSIKKNLNEAQDTVYKRVWKDSSFVRVPVIRKQMEKKSINEKAEEAANFILKLRKRKFKLIAGMSDQKISSGKAMNIMIGELNELEEEYLSLFIGKKYEETFTKTYTYTPNKNKDMNVSILFNFSEKNGIVSKEDKESQQVLLKVINDGKTKVIDSYFAKKEVVETKEVDGLVYRIPDLASVQVLKGEEIIARKKVQIAQFGVLNILPKSILKSKSISIQFNPNLGNIECISK